MELYRAPQFGIVGTVQNRTSGPLSHDSIQNFTDWYRMVQSSIKSYNPVRNCTVWYEIVRYAIVRRGIVQ